MREVPYYTAISYQLSAISYEQSAIEKRQPSAFNNRSGQEAEG
jgi:hypothetical protein